MPIPVRTSASSSDSETRHGPRNGSVIPKRAYTHKLFLDDSEQEPELTFADASATSSASKTTHSRNIALVSTGYVYFGQKGTEKWFVAHCTSTGKVQSVSPPAVLLRHKWTYLEPYLLSGQSLANFTHYRIYNDKNTHLKIGETVYNLAKPSPAASIAPGAAPSTARRQ